MYRLTQRDRKQSSQDVGVCAPWAMVRPMGLIHCARRDELRVVCTPPHIAINRKHGGRGPPHNVFSSSGYLSRLSVRSRNSNIMFIRQPWCATYRQHIGKYDYYYADMHIVVPSAGCTPSVCVCVWAVRLELCVCVFAHVRCRGGSHNTVSVIIGPTHVRIAHRPPRHRDGDVCRLDITDL